MKTTDPNYASTINVLFDGFIEGHPAPQPRPRQKKGIGTGGYYPKSKRFKAWEQILTLSLKPHRPDKPSTKPFSIDACFYFPMPRNFINYDALPKLTTPDCDNLIKTVKDVLQRLGFYANDSQVCFIMVSKAYRSKKTGLNLSITEHTDYPL